MVMLGYYKNGLYLFKENLPIIIMTILLAVWNLFCPYFLLLLYDMRQQTTLGVILSLLVWFILFLTFSFVCAAVAGITERFLLKEPNTLKTAWEIGKKYLSKVMLIFVVFILFWFIFINIVGIISSIILNFLDINPDIVKQGYDQLFWSWILGLFFIFVVPAIVIGQNTAIQSLKESVNLVLNNKIKSVILAFSLVTIYLVPFIPNIGDTVYIIPPFLTVYFLIVITLVYLDLTE